MSFVDVEYRDGDLHATVRGQDKPSFKHKYGNLKEWGIEARGMNLVDATIPSEYFGVSLAGCAALHVVGFLAESGLSTDGVKLHVAWRKDKRYPESGSHTMLVDEFYITVDAPGCPEEQYEEMLTHVRDCTVAASIKLPPRIFADVGKL
jgi:uncharacterized OsmC-like protein